MLWFTMGKEKKKYHLISKVGTDCFLQILFLFLAKKKNSVVFEGRP